MEKEKDFRRKRELKRIQEVLELYYRVRQRYPEAGKEFEGIVKNLEPSLEGWLSEYRYENLEGDVQRYRLWCVLESGLYELTSDETISQHSD